MLRIHRRAGNLMRILTKRLKAYRKMLKNSLPWRLNRISIDHLFGAVWFITLEKTLLELKSSMLVTAYLVCL